MSTTDRRQALSSDAAHHRAGQLAFADAGKTAKLGGVGLEQELFAIRVDHDGQPSGRLLLEGEDGVLAAIDREASGHSAIEPRQATPSGAWEYRLANRGRLTFEPGAQVEHSSTVHLSARAALDDLRLVQSRLQDAFRSTGARLAAAGLDLWHGVDHVPQQLNAGRYTAMAEFFDKRGRWGRVMMRHTASLQINLDLGPDGVWQERWLLANLMAPVTLATFAASPGPEAVSVRALAWQHLDPTRTGFPGRLVKGGRDDPRDQWAQAALDADVMVLRLQDGRYASGDPAFSFRDWLEKGHPELGWPTADDLDYHLTTLFPEVRPRGFLELRSCESLPLQWSAAPVVLITALLYDDRARGQALALLDGARQRLPELWIRAARVGIHDPELGLLASRLWRIALAGIGRLPQGYFGSVAVRVAHDFLDRFTCAGLMPADALAALMDDPRQSLAWATGELESLEPALIAEATPVVDRIDEPAAAVCAC